MITYKNEVNSNQDVLSVRVFSDGRRVGAIKPTAAIPRKWRYTPTGRVSLAGPWFDSIREVKNSLESE